MNDVYERSDEEAAGCQCLESSTYALERKPKPGHFQDSSVSEIRQLYFSCQASWDPNSVRMLTPRQKSIYFYKFITSAVCLAKSRQNARNASSFERLQPTAQFKSSSLCHTSFAHLSGWTNPATDWSDVYINYLTVLNFPIPLHLATIRKLRTCRAKKALIGDAAKFRYCSDLIHDAKLQHQPYLQAFNYNCLISCPIESGWFWVDKWR